MIEYHVHIEHPDRHRMTVSVHRDAPAGPTRFHLPAWTPGSYLIREFSRYLSEPSASLEDGTVLPVTKTAKGSWEVDLPHAARLTFRYEVTGHELTVRTTHIDGTHAFFTGTNALVRVEGAEASSHRLAVTAPEGWQVHSSLPSAGAAGVSEAASYDVLADGFIEAGPMAAHAFEILGVPHRCVFWGADMLEIDHERLQEDIRSIVETNARLFGGTLPYDEYLFVFHITASDRGGLEHLTGTVLATPWSFFETDDGYRSMLGLIAHEHFHVWNVKRIRPAALGPFDYQNENYTTGLWVAEGFTSYFDSLVCLRAKVWSSEHYVADLQRSLERYVRTPGRFAQSVAQSSFDAWIRLYRPDEETPNRTVSYYLKGAMVALALDLTIRDETDGEFDLATVMRGLWRQFEQDGAGFDDREMAARIQAQCSVDVTERLHAWVFATEDPDFAPLFASHGLRFALQKHDAPYLGVETKRVNGKRVVKHVLDDGPNAGGTLYAGDTLVAVDHREVTGANWDAHAKRWTTDRPRTVHVLRRGRLLETSVHARADVLRDVLLEPVAEPDARAARLREKWWTG